MVAASNLFGDVTFCAVLFSRMKSGNGSRNCIVSVSENFPYLLMHTKRF